MNHYEIPVIPTVYPVTCHTDHVGPGSTFVAIKGYQQDGTAYIARAVERGATTIIVNQDTVLEESVAKLLDLQEISLIRVDNTRKALAHLSARAVGYPATKLKIIGITGTKGKTTSSYLIEHCLRTAGYKTGLLSTVENRIGSQKFPTQLTTQQPDYLHMFFKACLEHDIDYVVMEVAAQAQTLYRTYGIEFEAIIFTNFSKEHGEFYVTENEYFEAKVSLLNQAKANAPIILNSDDQRLSELVKKYTTTTISCCNKNADYFAKLKEISISGISTEIEHLNQKTTIICPTLCGGHNVYNILGVYALLKTLCDLPHTILERALRNFAGVPGRMEHYTLPNGALGIIDYAHNPSSLEAVLSTLATMTKHLIVVFGAGGERDKEKRPIMGAIATKYAQHIILTSDNPRSENPYVIISDIISGINTSSLCTVDYEIDRATAIKKAYNHSSMGSIIAILGKGPDEYQIVQGVKTYFSDTQEIRSLI